MRDLLGEEFSAVLDSLFDATEDAVILADMKNVLARFSKLSKALPFGKFTCSASAVPRSSLLYHTLETLGCCFVIENKADIEFLNSVALPTARQWILNPYSTSRLSDTAMENGLCTFPASSCDQIQRLMEFNKSTAVSIVAVLNIEDDTTLDTAFSSAIKLFERCRNNGFEVVGLALNADFALSAASLARIVALADNVVYLARRKFDFEIVDLFFGPEFLKCDTACSEWFSAFYQAIQDRDLENNLSVHFDITSFVFVNAFKLWARIQDKKKLSVTGSRLYTVSEGVFSVFSNLLAMEDDEVKPFVVACSGLDQGISHQIKRQQPMFNSKIVGPSGDSDVDILVSNCALPDLDPLVDWLMIDFGAVVPSGLAALPNDPLLYVVY